MQNILNNILFLSNAYTGKSIETQDIIHYQRKLKLNNLPCIPEDYLILLHKYNSLAGNNFWLFGINPRKNSDMDIIHENTAINHSHKKQWLILGFDDVCYLAWNKDSLTYQLIDKNDFEVLNNYQNCNEALHDFLGLYKYE